jgi:hypothetical protein
MNGSATSERVAGGERCFRCGRPVDLDADDTRYMLTRVDPHTLRQRPLDEDEFEEVREARAREGWRGPQAMVGRGLRLGVMCPECYAVALAVGELGDGEAA